MEDLITKLQLKDIQGREVCCYSVSAKNQVSMITRLPLWVQAPCFRCLASRAIRNGVQVNIDITLEWLTKHAKSKK